MTISESIPTLKDPVHDFLDSSVLSEALKKHGITPDWFLNQLLLLYDSAKADADYKGAAAILQRIQQLIIGASRIAEVRRTLTGAAGPAPAAIDESDPAARLLALTRARTALPGLISERAIQYEKTLHEEESPVIDVTIDTD